MNKLFTLLLLLALPAAGGCHMWRYAPWGYPQPPQVLEQASTRDMVIAAVNGNAAKVQSLKTTQASLSVSGVPTSLPVDIALERPDRFRMKAEKLMMTQLDLGNNDELFWFWARLDPSGRMYFCRHASGAAAARLLPVAPERMGEAFGLVAFDYNDEISNPEPVGQGRLRIRSTRRTRSGTETKITVIDDRTAMVLEQHLYDAAGTKLISVLTAEHQQDEATGAWLPRKIDIHGTFQGQPLELSIEISGLEVNTLSAADGKLWEKPQYPGAVDFDLCGGPMGGPVGGFGGELPGASLPNSFPRNPADSAQPAQGFAPASGFAPQNDGVIRYNDPASNDDPTSSGPDLGEAAAAKPEADNRRPYVPWRRPK